MCGKLTRQLDSLKEWLWRNFYWIIAVALVVGLMVGMIAGMALNARAGRTQVQTGG